MRLPERGDFGLTKGSGLAGWVIRHGTASRYGHAVVAVTGTNSKGGVSIVEADPDGARAREVPVTDYVWSNLPLTEHQRSTIVGKAVACVGLPYDWQAILGFVIRVWKAKWSTGSDDHADDKLICSELVAWCYREAGIDLGQGTAPGDVSPGDLADWLFRQSLGSSGLVRNH